ncbi:MAG: SbcC/MukB-like Walker B domain-containing protein, partial [Candidatus Baltobacteraceae bacterium]
AAQASLREAERRRDEVRERGTQARDLWRAWTQASAALEKAREELRTLDEELRDETGRWKTLEAALASADAVYAAARAAYETAERANRAAALAHELHAGEACPVCRRTLPEGFAAQVAPDVVAAKRGCEEAERKRDGARTAYERGRATLGALERRRVTGEAAATARARDQEAAEKALLAAGLTPSAAGEDEALEPLRTQYKLASAEVDTAQERREAEQGEFVTADADVKARSKAQVAAYKAHKSALQAHAQRVEQAEAVRRGLPEPYRPAAAAEAQAFEQIIAAIEMARAHAAAVAAKQAALAKSAAESEGALRKAEGTYQRTVADASVSLRHALERSLAAVAASLQTCGLTAPPVRSGEAFEALASWCESLLAWCEQTRADAAGRAAETSAESAALEAALSAILRAYEVESAEAFERGFVARTAEAAVAAERLRAARENAKRAAALERELLELEPVVSALDQLNRYLQNRAFKEFVMRHRERRLLGLGTEILRGMTGERYAFAEGFAILDRHADQVRSAKTLSGGETFLASLALALALVEVASRSGGKLDALFLDEGFGSLDAAALDDALSELAGRAKGGKLIGIVTHVRGIAEQIDTVLRVERRATGSEIRRLEGAELAALMEDEVRSGLLQEAQTL